MGCGTLREGFPYVQVGVGDDGDYGREAAQIRLWEPYKNPTVRACR